MSKGVQTPGGLKYILSDKVFEEVNSIDRNTGNLWDRINIIVEYSEIAAGSIGFLCFCILAFCCKLEPWMIAALSVAAMLLSSALRNIVGIYRLTVLAVYFALYKVITKFFLNYIIVILLSVFVLHNWVTAAIYIVGSLCVFFITVGSYEKRLAFNDKVAKTIIRTFG